MTLQFPERNRPWWHVEFWLTALYCLAGILLVMNAGDGIDAEKLIKAALGFCAATLLFSFGLYLFPPKPFVKLEHGELLIRRPGAKPERARTFRVEHIEKIEIYGPTGGRYWRVHSRNGEEVTIPPVGHAWLEKKQTLFMQTKISLYLRVEVQPPPTMFAQIRGDLDWRE